MLKIQIPEDVSTYLERLNYEQIGLRNLVAHMERSKSPDEKFCRVMREYRQISAEYEMAKEALCTLFVPQDYKSSGYSYKLIYDTGILYVGEQKEIDELAR